MKVHVKTGDTVMVISGRHGKNGDVGKTGKVAKREFDKLCGLLLGGDRERVFMRMDEFADKWSEINK